MAAAIPTVTHPLLVLWFHASQIAVTAVAALPEARGCVVGYTAGGAVMRDRPVCVCACVCVCVCLCVCVPALVRMHAHA